MRFRKLRIAWSVFWGVACVLLIGLWVRSYVPGKNPDVGDRLTRLNADQRMLSLWSRKGAVLFSVADRGTGYRSGWTTHFVQNSFLGFGVAGNPQAYSCQMPYWFPFALAIVAGIAPWIRWRFTLRTLLIATTLVAVVLGIVVYGANR
jgi:hypothetical protein